MSDSRIILPSDTPAAESSRRDFLKTSLLGASAMSIMSMLPIGTRSAAWAAGAGAPEKTEVKIGFIPLTDCASVVMASVLGFDKKYGSRSSPAKKPAGQPCATNW